MKKRSVACVLTAVLAMTTVFGGCGKKDDSKGDTTSSSAQGTTQEATQSGTESTEGQTEAKQPETVDPLGKYDEEITITFFGQKNDSVKFNEGEDWENNLWDEHYKDKLNINTEYKWLVDTSQYDQQVAMAVTTKDLADIMVFKVGDKNLQTLYTNGQLADLSEVYDKYASDLTKQIINYDGGVGLSSCYDGDFMYALPSTNPSTDSANMLWVRSDWLEKSGKSFPTTMDELKELARIFAENDYDGVDAYGVAIYNNLLGSGTIGALDGFFHGFYSYPKQWTKGADGKLAYGGVADTTKQALEALADMYQAGSLDKEFVVKDGNAVSADLTSGKCGIAFGPQWLPVWPLNQGVGAIEGYDWVSGALPTSDGQYCKPLVPIGVNNYYVVRKDFEHPEALVKMMNLFVEDAFGDGDISYFVTTEKYQEPFKLAKVAVVQPDKNIQIWKAVNAAMNGDESLINENEEAKQNYTSIQQWQASPTAENNQGWGYDRIFGIGGSIGVLNDYEQKNAMIINEFYGPSTETMGVKLATLDKMQLETFTKIITGEADSSAFDDFVSKWFSLGGQDITDEVNEWYASTHSN